MTIGLARLARNGNMLICLLLLAAFAALGEARAQIQSPEKNNPIGAPWPAIDGLGRSLPAAERNASPRADRAVGMFYFLWHGQHPYGSPGPETPRDISRIMAADPDALQKPNSPLWGAPGVPHYWAQPLYGYYRSDDPWVLRRHAYLLADAGIDMLLFDTTNAVTYRDVFLELCKVFAELRTAGEATPKFAFMVNTQAGETAERIYRDLYEPGKYRELWFSWQGKPLLICDPAAASPRLREFFTLRKAHWPFTMVNTERAWHWEATYPQPFGYDTDAARPEQVSVSVAQNLPRRRWPRDQHEPARCSRAKLSRGPRGCAKGRG